MPDISKTHIYFYKSCCRTVVHLELLYLLVCICNVSHAEGERKKTLHRCVFLNLMSTFFQFLPLILQNFGVLSILRVHFANPCILCFMFHLPLHFATLLHYLVVFPNLNKIITQATPKSKNLFEIAFVLNYADSRCRI